jgi:hypothetical protein
MQRLNQIVLRMIAMATLACAVAACSSDLSLSGVTIRLRLGAPSPAVSRCR